MKRNPLPSECQCPELEAFLDIQDSDDSAEGKSLDPDSKLFSPSYRLLSFLKYRDSARDRMRMCLPGLVLPDSIALVISTASACIAGMVGANKECVYPAIAASTVYFLHRARKAFASYRQLREEVGEADIVISEAVMNEGELLLDNRNWMERMRPDINLNAGFVPDRNLAMDVEGKMEAFSVAEEQERERKEAIESPKVRWLPEQHEVRMSPV